MISFKGNISSLQKHFRYFEQMAGKQNCLILLFFYIFYSLLFFPRIKGAGNYWDAAFPYFKSQIHNFFNAESWSWVETYNSPLKYSADYYFRFLVSRITFFQPEHLLYVIYISIFAFSTFAVYLLLKKNKTWYVSCLVAIAVFVSPAFFYKVNAGHLDYLFSFTIFVFLILFLTRYFKPTFIYYLYVSLLMAFIGTEIQFFLFSSLVVGLYFVIWNENFRKEYIALLVAVPVLCNLTWLLNSLDGGVSVASLSANAAAQSFNATIFTNFINIFNFSFSQATQIDRYYIAPDFILFACVFSGLLIPSLFVKYDKTGLFYATNLCFFIFLGTGIYQSLPLPVISTFYPLFRESGHFAPIITLFLFLVWSEVKVKSKWYLRTMWALLVVFILINAYAFLNFSNAVNFASVRYQFQEFNSFLNNNPAIDGRVISYPFFDQVGFTSFPSVVDATGYRLNNTGQDSFLKYSSVKYVDSNVPTYQFQSSVQYQLLTNRNIDFLSAFSIDYLFDFSGIYQSYYEKYTSPNVYNENLGLIKDDPDFITSIVQNDPNSLNKIATNIYQVVNARPYISSFSELLLVGSTTDAFGVYKKFPDLATSFYYARVPYFNNSSQTLLPATDSFQEFNQGQLEPKSVTYLHINATRDVVFIKGATSPFFLALSENYGPKWRLEYGDIQAEGFFARYSPFVNIERVPDTLHFELNDALNGWYIDPAQVCNTVALCSKDPSGGYDFELTIDFWPQRWMDLGFVIFFATLVSSLLLIAFKIRRE